MPSNPRKILLWSTGAAALAVTAWLALREPAQLVSTATVARGPLEESFVEEGRTRLKQRYLVTAPVAGRVRRIEFQPGDAVRSGQVLAEIDPASSALLDPRARAQALAELRAANSAEKAAREYEAAARTAEAVARQELERQQRLQAAGMLSASALDAARTQAAGAAAELSGARAEVQIARQRRLTAEATLAEEGHAHDDKALAVPAPVDGVIIKRFVESATPVAVGQPLLELGDPAALEIEVEALSTDAVRLHPGLPARVLRWGGPGPLEATVTRIEPGGFTKVSALGVEEQRTRVILDLTSPRAQWMALGDAYRVEVEFVLRQQRDVLQVPLGALFRIGDGWAVYRVEGGVARRTPVKVGLRSPAAAQVVEGLQAGQSVIVQPDDRLGDGTRVAAVAGH